MENIKTFIFKAFLILLISGCSISQEKESIPIIDIESNISNFKETLLSSIADSIYYIKLETNPDYLISYIKGIDIDSDNILISDKENCLLYARDGKFILPVGKKGKGPGEFNYLGVSKLGYNYIFLPSSKNLLIYDKKGTFIKSVRNPWRFDSYLFNMNWLPLSDSTFICNINNQSGNEEHCAIMFDHNSDTLHLIKNYLRIGDNTSYMDLMGEMADYYYFDNLISFKRLWVDTLFRIKNNNEVVPAFAFHLGKYKYPEEYKCLSPLIAAKKMQDFIRIRHVYETKDYIFSEYLFANNYPLKVKKSYMISGETKEGAAPVIGIYNKKTGKLYFVGASHNNDGVNPTGIENDIDGGMNFFPIYRFDDSTLLMVIPAYQLKEYTKGDVFRNAPAKYPEKKKELVQLANSLDENDNPVLMLVKLKE